MRYYIVGMLADPELRDRLLAAAPQPENMDHAALVADLRDIELARQRLTDLAVDGTI